MSESNDQDGSKGRLSLRPAGRLELGRTVDAGSVRQTFSHGRSKVVQVEVRKKRAPVARNPSAAARRAATAAGRIAIPARARRPPARPAPGAGRALTATRTGRAPARFGRAAARRRQARSGTPRAGKDLHPVRRRGSAGAKQKREARRESRGRRTARQSRKKKLAVQAEERRAPSGGRSRSGRKHARLTARSGANGTAGAGSPPLRGPQRELVRRNGIRRSSNLSSTSARRPSRCDARRTPGTGRAGRAPAGAGDQRRKPCGSAPAARARAKRTKRQARASAGAGGVPARKPAVVIAKKGTDDRRRAGRIDVQAAIEGEDEKVRSLASVRRQRERERRQAELGSPALRSGEGCARCHPAGTDHGAGTGQPHGRPQRRT